MKMKPAYLMRMLILTLFVTTLWGCAEDEFFGTSVREGVPVELDIPLDIPGMKNTTRALTEEQERKMTDLYVIIFNKDKKVKFQKYFTVDELIEHTEASIPTNGKVRVKTLSGESYIYGVSNVRTNEYEDLLPKLDAVQTLDELNAITASLATPGNIERNQAALVMSGAFKYNDATLNEGQDEGYCVIPDAENSELGVSLPGKIILRRLDSRVRFNITYNNASSDRITEFKVNSWRVFNVPRKSNLISQATDAVASKAEEYSNSAEFTNLTVDGTTSYFEFYMPENRKKGLNGITNYSDREKEVKNTDGTNSGVYVNVEPYATFVEFNSTMRILDDNNHEIHAETKHTVHLGYINEVADDFKHNRNMKYTYDITVLNVDSIIVEATTDEENQPGAEGIVTEAIDQILQLDAHYHTFVLSFTAEEATVFKYIVSTPFNYYTEDPNTWLPEGDEDLTWLEFKRNTNNRSDILEYHNGDLLSVQQLGQDILNWKQESYKDELNTYPLNYTVFVKEYHYDKVPTGHTWTAPYWKYFVNQPDRYASLVVSPYVSKDTESKYVLAKYHLTQRSIQSHYSTQEGHIHPQGTAIGAEHINETGAPAQQWGNVNYPSGYAANTNSKTNGYPNTFAAVTGLDDYGNSTTNWTEYFSTTSFGDRDNRQTRMSADANTWGYSIKGTRDGVYPIHVCMSRNRDEDGDGRIDADEIKWYMPAIDQLVELYIGAESLFTPLFNANEVESITAGNDQSAYHLLSSTINDDKPQKLWADEGSSTGEWDYLGKPQKMRCVRDLGMTTAESYSTLAAPAFEYIPADRVIVNTYLNESSVRQGFISNGELANHDNFSRINLPYHAFKYSEDFLRNDRDFRDINGNVVPRPTDGGQREYRFQGKTHEMFINNNTPCANYYEEADRSDLGTWRLPNQRELALMWMASNDQTTGESLASFDDESAGAISITHWKYDIERYAGTMNGILFLDANGDDEDRTYNYLIRCVKDVQKR